METRAAIIVAAIVIASGCASSGTSTPETSEPTEKGLEIQEFKVADKTLNPGQTTFVTLKLKNYHKKEISIDQMNLYNTGALSASKQGCNPSEIGRSKKGFNPEMECRWELTAPGEDYLGGFKSKPASFNLNLKYDSELTNNVPLQIDFKPQSEIQDVSKISRTISNGEVKATVQTQEPVPVGQERIIDFTVENAGNGRVVSGYSFEYTPSIFSGCPGSDDPVVDSKVEFSCSFSYGQQATRNIIFSTSYKYVKQPTIDVEVVKP